MLSNRESLFQICIINHFHCDDLIASMSFSVFFKHHFKLQNNEALILIIAAEKGIVLVLTFTVANVYSNLDLSFVWFYTEYDRSTKWVAFVN